MTLSIIERIQLLNLLPTEGNIVTLRIINDVRRDLSFSEKEIKAFEIKNNPETGQIKWNPKKTKAKEIAVGDATKQIVVDVLKKLDSDKKLTNMHIPLWDKFVQPQE